MIWPNRYFLVPFNIKLSGNIGVLLYTGVQLFYWWLLFLICWYDLPFLREKMSSDGVRRGNSTALPANCKLCTAHLLHAGLHVHPPSAFAILSYCVIFFRLVFRWGIGFTGCSHHPLSTGSQHCFWGGSDFLQSSQEQEKNAERHRSRNTWYALQHLFIHEEAKARFAVCATAEALI